MPHYSRASPRATKEKGKCGSVVSEWVPVMLTVACRSSAALLGFFS